MPRLSKRRYDNKLRRERAETTRTRILDAVAEQLADKSLAKLSVARIAERAGVSEPTVYRHFANRAELWKAFHVHIRNSVAMEWEPKTIEDMLDGIDERFDKFDALAPYVVAGFNAPVGREYRKFARAAREEMSQPLLDELTDGLDDTEARHAAVMVRYLCSSLAWKTLREDHGFDGRESAGAVRFALKAIVAEVTRMKAHNQ
jgi:AcrR family transcriptional regulator